MFPSFPLIFFRFPLIFFRFLFISFHFPFVPLSCFFHFLSFSSAFPSCPFISLGNVIWEKPGKHMETPMSPRFSTPDSIQLTFFLGGGLVLEILFFLSFFHVCLGALFLFIFQTSNCIQSCFFTVSVFAGSARMFISFHFHSCCFISLQFYCRFDRVPRSFPSSFIGFFSFSFHFLTFSCGFLSFSFHVFSSPLFSFHFLSCLFICLSFPFVSFHVFSCSFHFLSCFFHFLLFPCVFLSFPFMFLSFLFSFHFLSFCRFVRVPRSFPFSFISRFARVPCSFCPQHLKSRRPMKNNGKQSKGRKIKKTNL